MADVRIGLIGLDTSHVTAFTKLLNDASADWHVKGGKVTVAYPGGSPDFELSHTRVKGFTDELRDKHGIRIVETLEAVAEQSDLVFIESVDGRVHLKQFQQIARFKKPTFIDKPLAANLADAEAIYRVAEQNGVPVMSCSSLRYWQPLRDALAGGRDSIVGCDAFGPLPEETALPGLHWYGVHTVEMIVATMGPGCAELQAFKNADSDIIRMTWSDGRSVMMRGARNAHHKFGMTLHRKEGAQWVDPASSSKPYYAGLLEAILHSLPQGKSDVPKAEMLEIMKIMEAANQSRQNGAAVKLGK